MKTEIELGELVSTVSPDHWQTPEQRLWLYVLQDAVNIVIAGPTYDRPQRDVDWEWFFLRSARCRVIVEILGIDWGWFQTRIIDRIKSLPRQRTGERRAADHIIRR